jgi:hypothetical protein
MPDQLAKHLQAVVGVLRPFKAASTRLLRVFRPAWAPVWPAILPIDTSHVPGV